MNGIVVVLGLVVALPVVALAGRVRRGAGRSVAVAVVRAISRACGISYRVTGLDRLDPLGEYVFVPNHSSPADIPAMLLTRPDARFAAAAELLRVPLLGSAMRALDVVPIDRKQPAEARRQLAVAAGEPGSLCVFAEGGIAAPGERRPFKSGAFVLAVQAARPVVPVSIRGTGDVLPRGQRIWVRPGLVEVVVHEPIDAVGLSVDVLRDRTEQVVRSAV